MTQIFDIIAVPLGYVLWFMYGFLKNYFLAIFLFTVVIRLATFPLSIKSQKTQADRAKLAPRVERLQKKYKDDPKKLQEKQMALYEKEGVSMTGGCLPLVIQMVILMGVISVIYKPLTHLAHVPSQVISASVSAVEYTGKGDTPAGKVASKDLKGYYNELNMMNVMDQNKEEIIAKINKLSSDDRKGKSGEYYFGQMQHIQKDFKFGGTTMLNKPWSGFKGISLLWLIPLLSGLTAMGTSMLSMHYANMANAGQKQPGQGCTNSMMTFGMPLFSTYITFIVPGAVGIYWICSNLIAVLQTYVLNKMYNPGKIRAQAEAEYEERRRNKAADKKRLAESRKREQEALAKAEKEEAEAANAPQAPTSKNPNKAKRRKQAGNTDLVTEPDTFTEEEADFGKNPGDAKTPSDSETDV